MFLVVLNGKGLDLDGDKDNNINHDVHELDEEGSIQPLVSKKHITLGH